MPPKKPTIITVPEMNFLAVRGQGNPNDENVHISKYLHLTSGINIHE